MTQAYTRAGSTVPDFNSLTGDSVTSAVQKVTDAIDDIYGDIQDGTASVKGVVQIGTTAGKVADGTRGVTNGDSHDHVGGDGAQIAYSGLSGLPTLGSAAAAATTDFQAADSATMKSNVVTARTRAHRFTPVAVTAAAGGALSIDCDLHEECTITLAETTTTVGAASNQAAGKYVVLVVTGTTGKALAWNTNWDKDGADCTIAAPANGVTDMHCFRSNGTSMKHIGSKLAV
jgi:hypothetical protein